MDMAIARGTGISRVPRPRVGRFVGSVFLLLLASAIATLFLPTEVASGVGALSMMVGAAVAGRILVRKAPSLPANERLSWRLLGTALLSIATGIAVLMTVLTTTSYEAAFGPPDLLFLLGYGIGMTGLAILPHTTGTRLQRLRLFIDGIIGAVALSALFWVFFYTQIADALADSPSWDRIVGSAYPLFDLLLLVTVMIAVVRRSGHRYDPRLAFIAFGAVTQAIADVAFLLGGVGRSFNEASPLFPIHLIAIGSFLAAAVIVDRPIETHEYAERPSTPIWAMVLPYGTAALMVCVLLVRVGLTTVSSADGILVFATLVVGLMVIVRQGVAIRENRRYVENQRTALVASISHELRTPLTAVVGFLELLDAGSLEDETEQGEVTAIATQQASYLSRIVSDLVMLASDNIATMELDVEQIEIDKLAWAAVDAAAIDPTNVRVDAAHDVVAFLDDGRIKQALANILMNAAIYGGDRTLLVGRGDGGDLLWEIHDNGPGVPRKYELLIWEKFERGPNRLNAVVPGSGIGLAVTNAIAKAHGGAAGYRRSELLGGSCFWLRLPGRIQSGSQVARAVGANLVVLDQPNNAKTA